MKYLILATIGVGCIMVFMTIITIPLMDRIGRRTLHLIGLGGIILCSIMITIALNYSGTQISNTEQQNLDRSANAEEVTNGVGIFLVIATLSFVVFFALGPGSIPWMAAGEMFSQGPRAPAISVCVFTNWLANLLVGLVFPQLQIYLKSFSFLPFLVITVVLAGILFCYFAETKGKTANEVADVYQVPGAWKQFIGSSKRSGNLNASQTLCVEMASK